MRMEIRIEEIQEALMELEDYNVANGVEEP